MQNDKRLSGKEPFFLRVCQGCISPIGAGSLWHKRQQSKHISELPV